MATPSSSTSLDPMQQQVPILVIGAGQAGAMALASLRQMGYTGGIVVVGDEAHAPYERPPLSKSVLLSEEQDKSCAIHAEDFYKEQDINLRLESQVKSIDIDRKSATLNSGEVINFASCLFATGGQARILADMPSTAPQVHYLRTLDDAKRLRAGMQRSRSLLIVGGGFIGLETSSTARAMDLEVTIIESNPHLLARVMPTHFSNWLAMRAEAFGVSLLAGESLQRSEFVDGRVSVELGSGRRVVADMALVSIGLVPQISLAREAGIAIDPTTGGIQIDARGQTSAPGFFAAGDCASQFQPVFGKPVRLESWQSANEQARQAAASMLGVDTAAAATPWFWTDLFDCNIQMLGAFDASLEYHIRGKLPEGKDPAKCLLFGVCDKTLKHVIAVNAGGDLRVLRSLFENSIEVVCERLTDVSTPLRKTVQAAMTNMKH